MLMGLAVFGLLVIIVLGYIFDHYTTQHYSSGKDGYTLQYAGSWKRTTPNGSDYTQLTSTQNGVTYTFRVSPPSQIYPEGEDNITWQTDSVTYDGRQYRRIVWKTGGKAFHITAVPQDATAGADGTRNFVMVMDFQPTASGSYLSVFDQVARTLKY